MRPLITLACGKYDRTEAIWSGELQVEGADLNYIALPPSEIFWRMLKYQEFDVSEMSLSSYLIARDRGFPNLIAVPVFPSRCFRHSYIFVASGSGIKQPQDLVGRKVGVPEYEMTAAVWVRGFLWHDFGVSPADIFWLVSREEKYELNLKDIRIQKVPDGKWLEEMLVEGEIDALIQNRIPEGLGKTVRRLFNNAKEVEADYYRRTGIFPIMHTLVMKKEIYERYPWLARSLYKAFEIARIRCQREMYQGQALKYSLPWLLLEIEEQRSILGEDFWPYGLEANRHVLEVFIDYAAEQGLIRQRLPLEELFVPIQWTNEPTAITLS